MSEIHRVFELYRDKRIPGALDQALETASREYVSLGMTTIWVKDEAGIERVKARADTIIADLSAAAAHKTTPEELDADAARLRKQLAAVEAKTTRQLDALKQKYDADAARLQSELDQRRLRTAQELQAIEREREPLS